MNFAFLAMGSNSEEKVRAWLSDVFVACTMDLEPTFYPLGFQKAKNFWIKHIIICYPMAISIIRRWINSLS